MGKRVDDKGTVSEQAAPWAMSGPDEIVRRELSAIMPVIAASLTAQSRAGSCAFFIYSPDASRTVAAFSHGERRIAFSNLEDTDLLPPMQVPIEREVLMTGRTVRRSTAADFERLPLIDNAVRSTRDPYVDMAVPLIRHDHCYGIAYLWRHGKVRPFSDDEVAAAESLVRVAAMAVEFARQYGEERVRRGSLNALLDVASLASSHLTVSQVMPAIARIVRSVTEADVCNLYVFDDSGNSVEAAFTDGLNERERWVFDNSDQYPVENVPAEEYAQKTLAPVVVRDPAAELAPNSELVDYSREAQISEILIVPIVYQERMIGVIYLWYRQRDRVFSEQAKSTAQGIANQAGGVVSQARLYDESRRHIAETEALRSIGEAVLNNDSLDSILDQIADVLAQVIPYDFAFVGTVSEDGQSVIVNRVWGMFPEGMLHYQIPLEGSLTGAAIKSGTILNDVGEFHNAKAHQYAPEHLPINSVLIAPLITENGTVGVLYAGRHSHRGFSPRQEWLMTLLSQHAAAAIERTKSRLALAAHARRQTFLAAVTNTLIAADEPVSALQDVAEMASGILADGVIIALSSWEYGDIRWEGVSHCDPDCDRILRETLEEGEIVVSAERVESILGGTTASRVSFEAGRPANGKELHETVISLLQRLDTSEMLTIPMRRSGRAPGLLILLASNPDDHLHGDIQEMSQMVASRIGDVLERRRMAKNREALLRVSESINSHADLGTLLDMFTDELRGIVPYDQMYLGKITPGSEITCPLAYYNPMGLPAHVIEIASNEGISGEVIRTGKAILDNHTQLRATSSYGSTEAADFYQAHGDSAMAAPLIAEGTVIGVLFIGRFGSNRFSDSDFETFLLFTGLASSALHRAELMQNNQLMYRASVEVLAAVVDAKDPTTLRHSRNVARYAQVLAEEAGLSPVDVEEVELAGLLHDIGKLSIPDQVLSKPGPLTAAERALINTHPERGAVILRQHPALLGLIPLVRHHHEWINGNGYPDGLRGDQIPLGASIISVADAFDTMTSVRTYQRRKSIDEALTELRRCSGSQFHPELVKLFVRAIRQKPELAGDVVISNAEPTQPDSLAI